MKRHVKLVAPLFALLVALPVSADAPLNQYEAFTQRSGVISDAFTKLKWERKVWGPSDFEEASTSHCRAPNRLPTLKELLSLVDEDVHEEYEGTKRVLKAIDQRAFPDTPVNVPYWTSTKEGADNAWTVNFADGTTATAPTSTVTGARLYARCVVPDDKLDGGT
jgi:hypothetical protein